MRVPRGWNLVLDEDTPALSEFWIDGGNVSVSDAGVTLRTGFFIVRGGGSITVGAADAPYGGTFRMLLSGERDTPVKALSDDLVLGSKVLAVTNGTLALFGAPRTRSVPLAADAAAGADVLTLAEAPVGWQVCSAPTAQCVA